MALMASRAMPRSGAAARGRGRGRAARRGRRAAAPPRAGSGAGAGAGADAGGPMGEGGAELGAGAGADVNGDAVAAVAGDARGDLATETSDEVDADGGEELLRKAATALLSATAGLDRGAAATASEAARVSAAADVFERTCVATSGQIPTGETLLEAIEGRWRLVYSSTFARVTTSGNARPAALSQGFSGAPPGLGAVFQDIRRDSKKGEWFLDNLVTLRAPAPPALPVQLPPQMRNPAVRATLAHKLSAEQGESTLRIVFEETVVRLTGVRGKVELPGPQRLLRGARYHLVPSAPEGAARDAATAVLDALEGAPAAAAGLPLLGDAAKELERFERDASELDVVGLGAGVLVTRSRLGELRVFVAAGFWTAS